MTDLASLRLDLPPADVLLVVPPLAHLTWPSLGVHVLQACAREAGFEVRVLYANALYAELVGAPRYAALCNAPVHWLLGERLFARAAWGAPPLGFATDAWLEEVDATSEGSPPTRYADHLTDSSGEALPGAVLQYTREELQRCEALAFGLAERLAAAIAGAGHPVVGATTTFDQTAACLALLARVKAARPATVTVLGGANCDGEMAEGVRGLSPAVDHVFSGESEATFVAFLRGEGRAPVIRGAPCADLDALPPPDFADWAAQVPPSRVDAPRWFLYETSRGCWWGARHHCTFCGLNAEGMGFRQRSPDRVVADLRALLATGITHRVCLTDNIMPYAYHRTLIPRLPAEVPGIRLFYEQKANLGLRQVRALFDAGCRSIQPGIEALDSDLLRAMRKGVLARQNVALLRYARSVGMLLRWNLLWGFPGDQAESYRRTAALLPLLVHLGPPQDLAHLHVDRFSPYFEAPEAHDVSDVRPLPAYGEVFPPGADLSRIAYHFAADYPCGAHAEPSLMRSLRDAVWAWKVRWEGDPQVRPALHVHRTAPGTYLLVDTRGLGGPPSVWLNEAKAEAVLVGGPLDRVPAAEWALANRFAVALDGWCVPLATAAPELLSELEERPRETRGEVVQVLGALPAQRP